MLGEECTDTTTSFWHTVPVQLKRSLQPTILMQTLIVLLLVCSFFLRAGKGIESTWLMAVVAAACATLCVIGPTKKISQYFFGTGLLFLLWSAASLFTSSVSTYGLDEILRDASGFLLFLCVAQSADDRMTRRLSGLLTILLGVAWIVGACVYVLQPVSRFVGVFFHVLDVRDYWPNAWAEWLLLVWPVALWFLSTYSRWVRIVFVGVVMSGLLLSFSRGAALVFGLQVVLGMLVLWYWIVQKRPGFSAWRGWIADGLLMIVVATTMFMCVTMARGSLFPVESLAAKATLTASEGTQTVDERKQFWAQAWELSLKRPVLGWGPATFRFVQPQLQKQVLATSDHPHNVILKLAMERGWPAALAFLIFVLAVLFRALSVALRGDARYAAFLIGLLGVLVHNLIDFNLQFTLIAAPFWLLLGCVVGSATPKKTWLARMASLLRFPKKMSHVFSLQRAITVVLAVGVLLVAILEGRFLLLERLASAARAENPAQSLQLYAQTRHALFPRDALLEEANMLLMDGELEEAGTVLREFLRRSPYDARVWILMGDYSMYAERFDDAHTAYGRAYALSAWNDLRPLHGLLQVVGRAGSQKELMELLPVAKTMIDSYANAIRTNTHFIALSWHVQEFEAVTILMAQMYPVEKPLLDRLRNEIQLAASRQQAIRSRERAGFLW